MRHDWFRWLFFFLCTQECVLNSVQSKETLAYKQNSLIIDVDCCDLCTATKLASGLDLLLVNFPRTSSFQNSTVRNSLGLSNTQSDWKSDLKASRFTLLGTSNWNKSKEWAAHIRSNDFIMSDVCQSSIPPRQHFDSDPQFHTTHYSLKHVVQYCTALRDKRIREPLVIINNPNILGHPKKQRNCPRKVIKQ